MTTKDAQPQPVKRSKAKFYWVFAVLFLLFFGPFLIAWTMYQSNSFVPDTLNNGKLLHPPVPVQELNLTNIQGQAVSWSQLPRKWIMLFIEPAQCQSSCEENLYKIRQVRKALGKNMDKTARAIVTMQGQPQTALDQSIKQDYQGTAHYEVTQEGINQFLQKANITQKIPAQGELFLVDPYGNVMMSYAADQQPKGILKDLKRLILASNRD